MAGTTNFIQFNPTAANQETDLAYSGDSQRQNGAINGQLFNDILANKAFYQWSTFITALANALVNKNYSPNDTDINTLESVLANIVTFNDLKSNLSLVAFSPTPIFNATSTNGFDFTLAGSVTSSTLTGQAIGQIITFVVTQGSTAYTFAPPSNINGWQPVSPTPNSVTTQAFIVKENGTIWPYSQASSTRQTNTYGSYKLYPDGTIECWGTVDLLSSGTGTSTASFTFPYTFSSPPKVTLTPNGYARSSGGPDGMCFAMASGVGTSSATANGMCPVPAGGGAGGGTFDQTVPVAFYLIGN